MKKSAVAIIPARGGSKRIPGKNIRPFFGKPIIQYTIEAALESKLFESVVVSTDSDEIAKVAISCGAEVPALRPSDLATDMAPTVPVIQHALKSLIPGGTEYPYGCLLLATAPFLQVKYLKDGFDLLKNRSVGSVLSVTSFPYPIFRALKLTEEGKIRWVWPEHAATRSNDLPDTFHDAAQFLWFDVAKFLASGNLMMPDSLPIVLPRHLVQDIDTLDDWVTAEAIYRGIVADDSPRRLNLNN